MLLFKGRGALNGGKLSFFGVASPRQVRFTLFRRRPPIYAGARARAFRRSRKAAARRSRAARAFGSAKRTARPRRAPLSPALPERKTRFLQESRNRVCFGIGLCLLGSSYGAGICASAAVDALFRVDAVCIAFFDCFNRASVSTCTTSDASVGNFISHWYVSSFLNCRQRCRYRNYSRQCAKNQVF